MQNLIVFVKFNIEAELVERPIDYVKKSYAEEKDYYYCATDKNSKIIGDLIERKNGSDLKDTKIVFILYSNNDSVYIEKLYVGNIVKAEKSGKGYVIHYRITDNIESRLVIENFMKFSTLNIEKDFEAYSYISVEDSPALMQQLMYATNTPRSYEYRDCSYPSIQSEDSLSELAQKNSYCRRFYNISSPSEQRGEFQRDFDRIIHCKSFRRMVDKAQVFSSSKGDHYRTRMTHTLCVVQIARSIASRLRMNVPLTESIALGHDLGHTPFGHQGERTLDKLVKAHRIAGFKHNFQSIKVASVLEEEYIEVSGLDLSVQTLEGMWKHTKIRKSNDEPLLCDLNDFIPADVPDDVLKMMHEENNFCSTVEGQIVAIADEIAQRSHDLDDALSANLLTVDSLLEIISLKNLKTLKDKVENLKDSINTAKKENRFFVSADELLRTRISSQVIDYFIDDVVNTFEKMPGKDLDELMSYFEENKGVNRVVIKFSDMGKVLNDYLETIVAKQVINSSEVAAFDDKAKRIVTALFRLYYDNPRLLHNGTLQRIYCEIRRFTDNIIHFQDGDISLVNKEWEKIKDPGKSVNISDLGKAFPEIDFSAYKNVADFKKENSQDEKYREVINYIQLIQDEYSKKNKILVFAICDFISGMTDSYAMNEYKKLIF